jgi:hypothetical protein
VDDIEQKYIGMQEALDCIKKELEQLRVQKASIVSAAGAVANPLAFGTSSTAASTAGGDAGGWVPRGFIVRGWAPFGCPARQRISREQAKRAIADIVGMLPEMHKAVVRPAEPFATNHQLFFAVPGGWDACRRVADIVKAKFEERRFTISGSELTVLVETSPTRKTHCKLFYDACRQLQEVGVSEAKLLFCQKGLRIYVADSHELLGYSKDRSWVWTEQLYNLGVEDIAGKMDRSAEH